MAIEQVVFFRSHSSCFLYITNGVAFCSRHHPMYALYLCQPFFAFARIDLLCATYILSFVIKLSAIAYRVETAVVIVVVSYSIQFQSNVTDLEFICEHKINKWSCNRMPFFQP